MKKIKLLTALLLLACLGFIPSRLISQQPKPELEQRVNALLAKMSLEEKVAQLYTINVQNAFFDAKGELDEQKLMAAFPNGIGSISFNHVYLPMEKAIKINNTVQKLCLEKTKNKIPCLFICEGLHGFLSPGATSFPQAIALGCTWDTVMIEKIFSATALETRSRGFQEALSPVLDLAREPRWGRTEETYSDDPYLVARLGKACVLGFQGRNVELDNKHVIATLKHFAGHGQGEGGNNVAPVVCDERYFRTNHLYPFEIAVKEAHVKSLMPSYNEWSGIPNHSNPWLLNTVLRDEWGFDGHIISDQGGIDDLYRKHFIAKDTAEAVKIAIESGVDFEIADNKSCNIKLVELVRKGMVSEKTVDQACRRVLMNKFRLGLFENPYVDLEQCKKVTNSPAHRQLALEAAHKAIVLLKNDKNILPLHPQEKKKIAVIGPNAAEVHLGGYSSEPRVGTSILEGFKQYAKEYQFDVKYAEGCRISMKTPSFWDDGNPILNSEANDKKLIAEAVDLAKQSDIVVLSIGENEAWCREAWSETHLGDRDNLDLIGRQEELAEQLLATGKPVIVVLTNGRPITINHLAKQANAIIESWYLGQEAGTALADVVFGKVNPSGKLSVTFPRSVGQLPCYYNHKPSRLRSYIDVGLSPLYPFGYGLSYTNFSYSQAKLEKTTYKNGENVKVSIEVQNTGSRAGDEIVQLYIRDKISSVTRPVIELKDFARISLAAGEKKKLDFTISPQKLEFYNREMKRVVEPGEFEVFIGPDSETLNKAVFTIE